MRLGDAFAGILKNIKVRSNMTANNSTKITLTEEDISGASLRGKIPNALTIPELKRWLSCRKGAKLSGTKRTLVER